MRAQVPEALPGQWVVAVWFALFWFLSVALVKWEFGLPLRTLVLVAGLGWLMFSYRIELQWCVRHNPFFPALCGFGLLGTLTSAWSGVSLPLTGLMLVKWAIQPGLILLFTMLSCRVLGAHRVLLLVLSGVVISAVVAILQGLDVQAAWDLKYKLEQLQGLDRSLVISAEQSSEFGRFSDRFRARGLSYSPIHLGYQVTLVFALLYYAWQTRRRALWPLSPPVTFALVGVLLAAVVFSGTRSSLFGLLLIIPVHMLLFSRYRFASLLLVATGLLLAPALFYTLSELFQLRIFSTSDSSFAARLPLTLLGLKLVMVNPLGYGWLVEASDLAQQFWHTLYQLDNAEVVVHRGIHNHAVKLLFVYGVPGLVLMLWLLRRMAQQYGGALLVGLSAYFFHALFHNDGIFLGGNYIWLFLGLVHYHWLSHGGVHGR
ncbi:O-antigen ligase family protein [Ferrimonas pelagia]|uniref:O-antigen ligase-related domain-containing protein n=1 Tax=Ferrimonas pelagia TaxID=1177826 RepID=A0ABP9EZ56_9GAMM